MNKTTRRVGLLFGLFLIAAESAQANVTFDDKTPFDPAAATFLTDGFSFSTSLLHTVTNSSLFGANNGTNYLAYIAGSNNRETFSMADQGSFALNSIDLGGSAHFGSSAQTLTVTGYQTGGQSITTQLVISPTSFQTYVLSGFTNLQSVKLGNLSRGYVAVDNIMITPVPEPETYAMMLAGLGLLAVVARRRKNTKG